MNQNDAEGARFNNVHVAVTGAGTGIGRAISLRLAGEGATLSLFARDVERLQATASLAREAGCPKVEVYRCDIRERAEVDRAFDEAAQALGPFGALVANAGVGGPNEAGEGDRFDDLVQTNLVGTYSCLRAVQRSLAPTPRRMIVIASILARIGVPAYTGYCASKAALLGLVRALSMELASEDVTVNAICPGWVDTDMATEGLEGMAAGMGVSLEEARRIAMQDVPLGRMSAPEDIAGLVAYLLSPDARGITGQGLDMNGGAWM